jgi:hypothetical protein
MNVNYIEILINIILASFGGLVKRLTELEKMQDTKISISYYVIGAIISMFVGIVVYFICKSFNASTFLTAGLTALSGYMGSPVLDLLSNITKKKLEEESKL